MVPDAARKHFAQWQSTGSDAALTVLIDSMFKSLEINNFAEIFSRKGDETLLKEDIGIDSLTLAELLFYLEDLVGVRIPNEEVVKIQSIGNLKGFLNAHRKSS